MSNPIKVTQIVKRSYKLKDDIIDEQLTNAYLTKYKADVIFHKSIIYYFRIIPVSI